MLCEQEEPVRDGVEQPIRDLDAAAFPGGVKPYLARETPQCDRTTHASRERRFPAFTAPRICAYALINPAQIAVAEQSWFSAG